MAAINDLYPPTPRKVPPDLTHPSAEYRRQVILVFACLVAFVLVYLMLTVGSAYLCARCVANIAAPSGPGRPVVSFDGRGRLTARVEPPARDMPLVVSIPLGVASGLVFLFLVKGLFKRGRTPPDIRHEITEDEQPELFAFIHRVCEDTGAPYPHRVFLLPDVNASVSFDETFLNLLVPSKKNLSIGLGLVNRLNLTEFKAVVAHEFGHFAQGSMRLGRYVYTANQVLIDLIHGYDWFDRLIEAGKREQNLISVPAWALYGVLWTLRQGLNLIFWGINFASVSMTRQMEYHADLVAVSVTGSDPLIFALARLDLAGDALLQARDDLMVAADHDHYSDDLYFHQTHAAEYLKAKRGDAMLGEVPPLPANPERTVRVFQPDDTSVPAMWSTHPANADREENAKEVYIRGVTDDRPAWVLFRHRARVRKRMTYAVYKLLRKERIPDLEPAADVQAFIDAEHAESTHPPQYHGLYENRYIKPGSLADLVVAASGGEFANRHRLAAAHARLGGDELRERMAAHRTRKEEAERLAGIASGQVAVAGGGFKFRGRRYGAHAAKRLLRDVERVIERDFEWMHEHDRTAFRVYYAMACQVGDGPRAELRDRYDFHFTLQGMHAALVRMSAELDETLGGILGEQQLPEKRFRRILRQFRSTRDQFQKMLSDADELRTPALANVEAGTRLGPHLFGDRLVRALGRNTETLELRWVIELMGQMGETIQKAARFLFKSMGAILAMQDKIAADWLAQHAAAPRPVAMPVEQAEDEEPPVKTVRQDDDWRKA